MSYVYIYREEKKTIGLFFLHGPSQARQRKFKNEAQNLKNKKKAKNDNGLNMRRKKKSGSI